MGTPHTSGSLAEAIGAELVGPGELPIDRLDSLERADATTLTFVRLSKHAARWHDSKARAVVTGRDIALEPDASRAVLVVDDVDEAMSKLLEMFAPPVAVPEAGIHPSCAVAEGAEIDATASIGPQCTIGAGARIGPGVVLRSNISIGADSSIGEGSLLHSGVVIARRSIVGKRCIFHGNVVIGADGFGYRATAAGPVRVPHLGIVRIEDDVEIGACACIDRAKFGETVIGAGTKIDNLVQIGHNCSIGKGCIICGHCGISGSVTMGDGVVLGGGVGVADNITIGDGAKVGANGGVMNDIPAGETWIGLPAGPADVQARNYAAFRKLSETLREIKGALRRAQSP